MRVTFEAHQLVSNFFNPDEDPIGHVGKGVLIVPGQHARLDNIDDNGRWVEDETFSYLGEMKVHRKGESARRALEQWVKIRRDHPHLLEHYDVYLQPSSNQDNVIMSWVIAKHARMYPASIYQRDCFAASFSDDTMRTMFTAHQIQAIIPPKMTAMMQLTDTDFSYVFKSLIRKSVGKIMAKNQKAMGTSEVYQMSMKDIAHCLHEGMEGMVEKNNERQWVLKGLRRNGFLAMRPGRDGIMKWCGEEPWAKDMPGHRRARLIKQCERTPEEANVNAHTDSTPDTVWHIINTAVVSAARGYPHQKKHADDPADTQAAHAAMVEARVQLVSLPRSQRMSTIFSEAPSMDFLCGLLQQWKCLVHYWRARRRLAHLVKRDKDQWHMYYQVARFNGAWFDVISVQCGKSRVFFLDGRLVQNIECIAGRSACGPIWMIGLLTWHCPATWVVGKLNVTLLLRSSIRLVLRSQLLVWIIWFQKIFEDYLRKFIGKLGKTVPDWAAPSEVWRQLFHPSHHQSQLRSGIGYAAFAQKAPVLGAWMQQLASSIRRWKRTPSQWQHSMSFQLDKCNGKPGCQGLRLVSCLDPCGAAFYKRGPAATELMPPDIVGKNPDWSPFVRCTLFLIGCVSGSFPTQELFLMSGMRFPVNLQQPFQLLWTVWQGRLIGVGKHWCVFQMVANMLIFVLVLALCKVMDPQLNFSLNLTILNWISGQMMSCRFLFGEDKQDLSMATFADDISRISLGQTPADLCLALQVANASLDRRLWENELVQNIQKQEHVVYFGGSGSQQHYETVYGDSYLPGQTVQSARYLGARAHYAGKNFEEVNVRLQAATRNWVRVGRFWFRSGTTKRGKTLVYSALVHSALLSGLETLLLEPQNITQLNTLVLRHGRKLVQGKACEKHTNADGTVAYKACRSKVVWKWLGLCPCELELQVRRLQWYQQLAREKYKHKCVLMAMFGKLGRAQREAVDLQGCVLPRANPLGETILHRHPQSASH